MTKNACSINRNQPPSTLTQRQSNRAPLVPPISGPIPDPLLNWVTEVSNVSGDHRWTLLTNLKAAASYQFRVSAVNSVGEGSPSEPSNQVMLPQEGTFLICLCLYKQFESVLIKTLIQFGPEKLFSAFQIPHAT